MAASPPLQPTPEQQAVLYRIAAQRARFYERRELRAQYRAAVRAAFSARRKTLENNLMSEFHLTREGARGALAAANIPEGVRGETLSPEQFALLSDVLFDRGIAT